MLCLGIESSCDETALALVKDGRLVDSIMASQAPIHAIFGGVVPELASREHYRLISPLFDHLLQRNNIAPADLHLVAVARGPGLLGSLLVGVNFAKALSLALNIPFIGVNHLHAHLLGVGLENEMTFPAIGVLVSGGHTQIYRINSPDQFIELGKTLDDAAGEVFDKVGSVLGFEYPAGQAIAERAALGSPDIYTLPRPYLDNDNVNFSFSGLKTAAINCIKNYPVSREAGLNNFCASFNQAVADVIAEKTMRALMRNCDAKTIWLAGGVAANSMLRKKMAETANKMNCKLYAPSPEFCADNGAIIAFAGYLLHNLGLYHELSMETLPRGKKIPNDYLQKTNRHKV